MNSKEIVRAFVDAHNAHDIEKMMSYLAPDSVMIDVAAPIPLNGKDDVRKLFGMIFSALDVHFEITGMISEGSKAFAALRTTGEGTGTWAGRDVRGLRFDVFESMFVDTRDDRMTTVMFYSDTASLSRQLGNYDPAIDMTAGVADIM
jgi:predicted ester cyclase